jgi:hypothetical protein
MQEEEAAIEAELLTMQQSFELLLAKGHGEEYEKIYSESEVLYCSTQHQLTVVV